MSDRSTGERITLRPQPASAGLARDFVTDELMALEREDLVDAAQLAVSELVTNAVLHASTDVEVAVLSTGTGVRIEVSDAHPGLPAARNYGGFATTGRGLGLVNAVATDFGVEPRTPVGKTIWFTLTTGATADTPLGEWDIDLLLEELADEGEAAGAVLLGLPVMLWNAAQQHHDAVLRELLLYRASPQSDDGQLGAAQQAEALLASAVDAALSRAATEEPRNPLPPGHPSPLETPAGALDVHVAHGEDAHRLFGALQDVLDEAEALAAAGRLLVRPALPEIIALRDWSCEQVVAQTNGVPPSRWGGTDREVFARGDSDRFATPAPAWEAAIVRDSGRCALAADDNNRLIAVSTPAAQMLGWEVSDLVGRRVVTLVPHRHREAHVAGFTRHLTTGEAHVLGVPLDLPVLHADGHEITCTFLIVRADSAPGRTVYVSWLTPPETT